MNTVYQHMEFELARELETGIAAVQARHAEKLAALQLLSPTLQSLGSEYQTPSLNQNYVDAVSADETLPVSTSDPIFGNLIQSGQTTSLRTGVLACLAHFSKPMTAREVAGFLIPYKEKGVFEADVSTKNVGSTLATLKTNGEVIITNYTTPYAYALSPR